MPTEPDTPVPPTPPAPTPSPSPAPAPAPEPPAASLDVDKVRRDAAKAAKAEAEAQFKAYLEAEKKNEDREKLDAQAKAEAERDEARQRLEIAELRAAKVEHDAKVSRRLLSAGVSPDHVDRVALMVTAQPGATDEDIDAAITDLRNLGLAVFANQAPTPPPAPGMTAPVTTAPSTTPAPESEYERGIREAKDRRAYLQSA